MGTYAVELPDPKAYGPDLYSTAAVGEDLPNGAIQDLLL